MKLKELKSATGKTFLRIGFDTQNQWVHADWHGYPTPDNVATGAIAYLNSMKEHDCHSVLNDNRNLVGPWDQSLDWLEKEWIPYAVRSGLKHFAHVGDNHSFSTNSASNFKTRIKGAFEMEIFDDVEKAKAWLKANNVLQVF
ncbi:STAS/SEC14 domain-containing protein [Pontibacter silvestris]|uniref:STAS/SEC14 domain-containing protein n=1 Tax=Pontibacter silvestris TaxID=2305183 RepID=A0ABW4WSI1_9BACT|nr:STAS/SEC14 domain-containing protein [Pontibacter silvestris]MCC9138182.1 STAS/SEC14 domain-containing protein [Pontibacter silvestris]